jgi:hypothetical protein
MAIRWIAEREVIGLEDATDSRLLDGRREAADSIKGVRVR